MQAPAWTGPPRQNWSKKAGADLDVLVRTLDSSRFPHARDISSLQAVRSRCELRLDGRSWYRVASDLWSLEA
jgi:hypothetical protein